MSRIGIHPGTEIEFLRKNNNRKLNKKKRIRSVRLKTIHVFLIIIIFLGAGLGAFKIGKFITGWKLLSVKTYKLTNSPVFMNNRIRKILKKYHGNILALDLGELRDNLLTIKEIKDVEISRRLPSSITITFHLRKPVFQLVKKSRFMIADREGVIISEVKKAVPGLITIKITGEDTFRKIRPALEEISRIRKMIEYVSYKEPAGIVLKLKNYPELFKTGNKHFLSGLKRYLALRKKLIDKENPILRVDLRFTDRLYLEYKREVI